jgi:hypothetical protein
MAEHEAILNALQRRDAAVLSSILKTHLRNKLEQVEKAGFAESGDAPPATSSGKSALPEQSPAAPQLEQIS